MKLLYTHHAARPADPIGGKAAALAGLEGAAFPIPAWFVLAPAAFERIDGGEDGVPVARLSAPARNRLEQALGDLCPAGEPVAVRSSAMEEDGEAHSFAGQLNSFLSVAHEDVPARAAAVWQSAFSPSVLRYRAARGLHGEPAPPAVLVQRMVDADVAGVAFGADPVSGRRDQVVVSAVRGLADRLVSGQVEGETFHVDARGGVQRESADATVLSDARAREIAALARRVGAHFGCPQDIEWAVSAAGELVLLQSRPITSLGAGSPDRSGGANRADAFAIWDNSNIVESYRGTVSPLTFSFARGAYEGVYRQFCRILRVPSTVIAANDATFKAMLGRINGRIYYNLLNWYRVLAMLPGYKVNRRFMEQMMGVKEGLPDEVADEIAAGNATGRVLDGFRALTGFGGLLVGLFGMRRTLHRFRRRLETAMRSAATPLERMSARELAAHYRDLEARMLTRWDAPLLNDFFCMIFYGVLARLAETWCGDRSLHDELLQGSGGMISAEPVVHLRRLASLAVRDPALVEHLVDGSLDAIQARMARSSEFRAAYAEYLERFGERCVEELKLEAPTLHDDPLPLLRAIGQYARRPSLPGTSPVSRSDADSRLREAFVRQPLRAAIFRVILRQARTRIRERENLRFERTRIFGRVRRIFVELGRRFHAEGALREPRDVFYLEVDEILGVASRGAGASDLQSKADAARREEARLQSLPAPPSRFETRGPVARYVAPATVASRESSGGAERVDACGRGCSPGVARGRARIVRDPRNAGLQPGEILVAESTDPGWILLFPLAAGLVIERGSPLSHSAIVARELGIPAVVSLAEATDWLRDGDVIEIDGSTGTVRRIEGTATGHSGLSCDSVDST